MELSNDVQMRCRRFFGGLKKSEDLTIEGFYNELELPDHRSEQTFWRMFTGGHERTHWDIRTFERATAVASRRLQKPYDSIFNYLMGTGEPECSARLREIELADFLLPRPRIIADITKKAVKYEPQARKLILVQRVVPLAQAPLSFVEVQQDRLLNLMGNIGDRLRPGFRQFAEDWRIKFIEYKGWVGQADCLMYFYASDIAAMRDRKGCFAGIPDEDYYDCIQGFIEESVRARRVLIGIIDDRPGRLPSWLMHFFEDYEGLLMVDGRFLMASHRHRLSRSCCERTKGDSPANRHLDRVLQALADLPRYLDHSLDKAAVIARLEKLYI